MTAARSAKRAPVRFLLEELYAARRLFFIWLAHWTFD
jgi:hypothetical protein